MTSRISSTLHQINELLQPAPELGSDSDVDSDTQAKLVDKYDDEDGVEVEPRRSNLSVISSFNDNPRYTGKKISRKNVNASDGVWGRLSQADKKVKHSRALYDSKNSFGSSSDESDEKSINSRLSVAHNDNLQSEDENYGEEGKEDDGEEEEVNDYDDEGEEEEVNDYDDEGEEEDEDDDDEDNDDRIDDLLVGKNSVQNNSSFQHLSNSTNLLSEIEKGNAVRNQLCLWDKFVECRINLQKCVGLANRLPQHSTIETFKLRGGESFSSELKKSERKIKELLDKLLAMQETLITSYSETSNIGKNSSNNSEDEEIESDDSEKSSVLKDPVNQNQVSRKRKRVEDYENELSSFHSRYVEFRDGTIQKWNDRTRVSSGKTKRNDFSSFEQTTLQQIKFVLSNRPRLIQRTRHRSAVGAILGEQTEGDSIEKEFDPEIFDDSDFYHQILKELIERHSDGAHDATALGRRWATIQKLRTKMKRKIDTRATKGRKLRYTPHQKLVGLMAPVNLPSNWDDRATTELFNSLFGKKL